MSSQKKYFFKKFMQAANKLAVVGLRWCFVVLLILSSCKKPDVKIPADIIQKDSMVQIIVDVQIAEAAITQKTVTHQYGLEYAASFYKYVFNKHHITTALYTKSIQWYAAHPDIYKKIYEQVITELSKRQATLKG